MEEGRAGFKAVPTEDRPDEHNGNGGGFSNGTLSAHRVVELLKTAFALAAFFLSGPCLIMTNRSILKDIGFPHPLTLSCFTLSFCSAFAVLLVHIFGIELRHHDQVNFRFYMQTVMPIGALTGATIVMGMTSYLYLTVAFVQMLKAFTPVMVLGFAIAFKLDNPNSQLIGSVLVISFGTIISGYGELNFNIVGVFCMLLAQFCEALRLVFTQKFLQNLRFDVIETLYYVTPASAFWVFLAASVIELPNMDTVTVVLAVENAGVFATAGFFAVSTNLVNWFVIQRADALMLKLVATARNAVLVLFNAVFMSEVVTFPQVLGYSIQLGGFVAYNYLKIKQREAKR